MVKNKTCTNELKKLKNILNSLIKKDEVIAEKYLQGFLEYKKFNSLEDYIKSINC